MFQLYYYFFKLYAYLHSSFTLQLQYLVVSSTYCIHQPLSLMLFVSLTNTLESIGARIKPCEE